MPMPRLLKRFSRKNLRQRSQSTSSTPDTPPIPKSAAASEVSFGYVIPSAASMPRSGSSAYFPPTDPYDKPFPPIPNGTSGHLAPSGAPYPPLPLHPPAAVIGNTIPDDDFSKNLQGAWTSATTDPKASKTDKALLKLENGVAGAMAKEAKGDMIMTAVKTGLDAVGGMEAIEKGLNSFMEGMPVLMNALDEVAKLHPFIGVAVMAFKAVWALEQKRRDNDRKILALHMEMKEMMGVLTQLKNVKDSEKVAPDGSTIKGRMQVIVNGTAEDIKACANTCDTYSKKKLLVKVLKGPIWEGKLIKFVETFTKRRSEFEFALSIHTALGVDAANKALNTVDQTTQEMNAKMDMMMKMFQNFVSPEQKEMARLVEQRGGQAVLENDKVLKELNDFENKSGGSQNNAAAHSRTAKSSDIEDLKEELHLDVDAALEQNMTVFNRKFEIQKRQIVDELSRVIQREGDRVISAVTAGPHDKIIDPDVHIIWKEMGWRGSVKTRHFVMALRDHFQEGHKGSDEQPYDHAEMRVDKVDEWALEYINVVRLQPISEAFDDDSSGWVTVAEVNAFTTQRPLEWSVLRWLAFWGVGHHQTMQVYTSKINVLLAKMFSILPHILPVNKSIINTYLETVYRPVYTLTASLNACHVNEAIQERFATYVAAEEARLRANLEAVQYDIDALDTLALVTGDGRIDRYILPLMFLLLERHWEIMRAARTRILHPDETWDAADTMVWVFDAVALRVELLQSVFTQQKLDLKQQFKSFSHGLYEYCNDENLLWDDKLVLEADFAEYTYDDSVEAEGVDITKILNYPVDQDPLDFDAYAPPKAATPLDSDDAKPLPFAEKLLNVKWHGVSYWNSTSTVPNSGMCTITLRPSSAQGEVQYFTAAERANRSEFKVTGECRAGDEPGAVLVTFKRSFPARFPTQYYTGRWDVATDTLTGTVGPDEDPATQFSAFVFKRIMPEHMCFWPAPVELQTNKARALWGFAIAAVRFNVRRERWAWLFFNERRDNRKRFIELYIRSSGSTQFGTPLNDAEWLELALVKKTFCTADSRFYHSLGERQIRATVEHNASCDACGANIGGARITCLVCQIKGTFNTVDLCTTPDCLTQRVIRDDMQKAHLSHHDLMKVRRVVHTRQFGKTYRDAKEALKHARTFFAGGTTAEGEDDSESSAVDTDDEEGHAPLSAKRLSHVPALGISIPQTAGAANLMSAVSAARSHATQVPDPVPSGPACCGCSKPVAQPCWYCVQCEGASFICWDCDTKGEVSFGEHDFYSHDLVRVNELIEERDLSVEERLKEMEERFSKHEKVMDERLGRLEAAVDGRMVKVERLLEQLLVKLGTP